MLKILTTAFALLALPATAETWDIGMFNRSESGAMTYEPSVLQIAPGDTLRFLSAQPGHNAATIEGMIPVGATPFKSPLNKDFEVTLTIPGLYGIKCSPHLGMGMVMLVQVGEANRDAFELPADLPPRAAAKFDTLLGQLK